ncbi:hypothetical protein AAF712_012187 [Marasmius tenuissimus]|uniref:Uncharacterized protein n=1 Tax=Marasmius tenuissimus TaxID=585030 RepID=A0ABR2ZJ70_9AGAR
MQFSKLSALSSAIVLALWVVDSGSAAAVAERDNSYLATANEIYDWIATTDADLTFIGDPIDLTKRAPLNTMVVYCSQRTQNICGGACTVYNGNARCLNAPNTNCLRATTNVGFCDRAGCSGSCNQYSSCGTRLDGGFCYTPGTRSINVPFT